MSTTTDSIGRVLARRYRIESALGSGTSATVYAAWDVVLQRRVAIKVLHPGLAGDTVFLRRFRYEAQSAAPLTHPHVLSVYDWGEDDRGPFLVLEYLGGGSLRDLLDNGRRVSVAQAAALGVQAAEALAYAHGRGFVHRDIKPANLVFDEDGRLRVADFGLARALAEAAMTEPAGATVGTARYAAPEQALGHPVDGRADVYSLGLVLYEAVTGVVPFTADTTAGHPHGPGRVPYPRPRRPRSPGRNTRRRRRARRGRTTRRRRAGPSPDRARRHPPPARSAPPGRRRRPGGGPARGPRPADRTEHGMGPPVRSDRATPTDAGRHDPDAMAMATAVGVAAPTPASRPGLRKQRRRWPWIVSIVVLVLALAAAGGAYAASRTKFFVPSHRLAVVTGLTPTQAPAARPAPTTSTSGSPPPFSATVADRSDHPPDPGPGTTPQAGQHRLGRRLLAAHRRWPSPRWPPSPATARPSTPPSTPPTSSRSAPTPTRPR